MKKIFLLITIVYTSIYSNESFLDVRPHDEFGSDVDIRKNNANLSSYDRELIEDTVARYVNEMVRQKESKVPQRPLGSYTLPLQRGHLFLEGDYLYWKPYGVIPYAFRTNVIPPFRDIANSIDLEEIERIADVNIKAHSGYRILLGLYLPPKTWYVTAQYTQFFANGIDSLFAAQRRVPGIEAIKNIWGIFDTNPGSGIQNVDAYAEERLRLKIVDGNIARTFITNSCFTFDPFFSIRYAQAKLDLKINYRGLQTTTGKFVTEHVDLNNHFDGIGLRGGFKANWMMGWGFEVFGNTSFSTLLGTFYLRTRNEITQINNTNSVRPITVNNAYKFKDIQSTFQFALGLLWGAHYKDKFYLGIKAGYEMNLWPEFIRLFRAPLQIPSANESNSIGKGQYQPWNSRLSMQGVTGSIRFDF